MQENCICPYLLFSWQPMLHPSEQMVSCVIGRATFLSFFPSAGLIIYPLTVITVSIPTLPNQILDSYSILCKWRPSALCEMPRLSHTAPCGRQVQHSKTIPNLGGCVTHVMVSSTEGQQRSIQLVFKESILQAQQSSVSKPS